MSAVAGLIVVEEMGAVNPSTSRQACQLNLLITVYVLDVALAPVSVCWSSNDPHGRLL
jgi:hypothetical protein